MRHDADHGAAGVAQVLHGADGLRQLHQRENPLLHAGAAGSCDRDEGDVALARALAGAHELLADDAPHRAAHEAELHHRELARLVLDRRPADQHRLTEARRELGFREPLGVGPQVEELERVVRAQLRCLLRERVLVDQLPDALARVHGEVMAALRADP